MHKHNLLVDRWIAAHSRFYNRTTSLIFIFPEKIQSLLQAVHSKMQFEPEMEVLMQSEYPLAE